jgi:hypothetical protein
MRRAFVTLPIAVALVFALASCDKSARPDLVTPVTPSAATDPHAGFSAAEIPAGFSRRGTVLQSLAAGEYSYIQIEENGKQIWIAVMATKVSKGDVIEFPDSPAFTNFQSKILNKTFDTLIFAEGIKNNGKSK